MGTSSYTFTNWPTVSNFPWTVTGAILSSSMYADLGRFRVKAKKTVEKKTDVLKRLLKSKI